MKDLKKRFKLVTIWMVLFLIFGELTIRIYDSWNQTNLHKGTAVENSDLGWMCKENHSIERTLSSNEIINYSTSNLGFKAFEQNPVPGKTVWFIGDSFTQAVEVNNSDSYYEKLRDSLDFSLFAYGMSGYGTLQEKLIIDKFKNEVNPDLVVLQFCSNDFIDNHYHLNVACNYKIDALRPYQKTDGTIYHNNPYSKIEQIIFKSRFLGFIHHQANKIKLKINPSGSGEAQIAKLGKEYPVFNESTIITRNLLKEMKESLSSGSELIVFCADGYEPQLSQIKEICRQEEITFFEDHIHRLRESAHRNENPYASDGVHWNKSGHQIVAHSMVNIIDRFLINIDSTTMNHLQSPQPEGD